MPNKKYKLIYKGTSRVKAEAQCDLFWKDATPTQKMQAINDLINQSILFKGQDPNALRLLRSTAVIKRA